MYKCEICKKEYDNVWDYANCVSKCSKELRIKEEAEKERKRLEEVNGALNRLKAVKKNYEYLLADFEKKYPEEYKMNFGAKDTEECSSNLNKEVKRPTISCGDSIKNKPINKFIVNGKEVETDDLFSDPDVKYLAKLLGILD